MRVRQPEGRRTSRSQHAAGYTLIEVLTVIAIIVGFIAISAVGVRRLRQSDLRTAATKLAGALRYSYDRAATTGRYHRLVIDLQEGRFWPEASDDRFYLTRGRGGTVTEDEEEDDDDRDLGRLGRPGAAGGRPSAFGSMVGLMAQTGEGLSPGNVPAKVGTVKARFSSLPDANKRGSAALGSVKVTAVWTARFEEPITEGRAYLYYYPEGRGERAIIHLKDEADGYFSVTTHPLTGRVEIRGDRVEIPRDAVEDDSGRER